MAVRASPRRPRALGALMLRPTPRQGNVVAGLLDAGLGSLATFVVGIFAVYQLDPNVLGGYALVYQLVFLVGLFPAQLVFVPAEVKLVALLPARRPTHLLRSAGLGVPVAALAAGAVALWLLIVPRGIPPDAVRALTWTAIPLAALSPIQDHVRRLLHSGGASGRAAIMSAVQLAVVVLVLIQGIGSGIPPVWLPFGALAVANLVSAAVGLAARPAAPAGERLDLGLAELVRHGRWLLWGGLSMPATAFASAALVSHLASAATLGYAEAARVLAQPVWVLAVGMSSVLGPASMEAAQRRRPSEARRVSRSFLWTIGIAAAANLLVLGFAGPLNPVAPHLPSAYVVGGLVAMTILAQALSTTIFPFRSELVGAGRQAAYSRVELTAGFARTTTALSAPWLHAFAIPVGMIAAWVVRWFGFRRALGGVYGGAPPRGT